jgi:hypothetical protein
MFLLFILYIISFLPTIVSSVQLGTWRDCCILSDFFSLRTQSAEKSARGKIDIDIV